MELQQSAELATVTLEVAGQTVMLLPERVVFLPDSDTLLVADVHIGKAASFRFMGIPVPGGTTDETLSRLSALIDRLDVRRVIFLGDLLHSVHSLPPLTLAAVVRWRERHSGVELTLVRGNHDGHAGDPPAVLDIQAVDEPLMHGGLALCHHPRPVDGAFVLAGHLHPCVSVGGRGHDWHRLPCFWFMQRMAVLPAFGAFTGMQTIKSGPGERVFASTKDRVFLLQPRNRSGRR
jgi:DNA ligase-associated metallophosphoesterase